MIFGTPSIVTNGLVLHLDAGSRQSYTSGSTTWSDLSGNNRTTTLFNTPSYVSTNNGLIRFTDTSNQYATASNIGSLTTWTMEAWFNLSVSLTNKVTTIITNQYNGVSSLNFSMGTNNSPSSYNLCVGFFNGAWRNTTGFAPAINTWYQVIGTYDGATVRQYVNGAANGGTLSYAGTPQSGGEIRLMRRWDDVVTTANLCAGSLSNVKVYNRALSAQEVTQNYNALKNRFGLS